MENYISHHGIKGQRWGVRRYQNEDGTLIKAGKDKTKKVKKALVISGLVIGTAAFTAAVIKGREYLKNEKSTIIKTNAKLKKVGIDYNINKKQARILSSNYKKNLYLTKSRKEAFTSVSKWKNVIDNKQTVRVKLSMSSSLSDVNKTSSAMSAAKQFVESRIGLLNR